MHLGLHWLLHTVGRLASPTAFAWGRLALGTSSDLSLARKSKNLTYGIQMVFKTENCNSKLFVFTFFYDEDVEHGMMAPKDEGSSCSPSPAASLPSGSVLPGSRGCSKGCAPLRSSVAKILGRDTVFHVCTWQRPWVAFWETVVKRDLFIIYLCYLFQDIFQFRLGFLYYFWFCNQMQVTSRQHEKQGPVPKSFL